MLKIATWNVNSLKVRLPQVLDWLALHRVDVLCLQELKMTNELIPVQAFQDIGYHIDFSGQKTYNGVAIISLQKLEDRQINNPLFDDEQQRLIALTLKTSRGDIRIVNGYCPNGQDLQSDKFQYKLAWYQALHTWLSAELIRHPKLIFLGDFNIAPHDVDVHDPLKWDGGNLVSPQERKIFQDLLSLGLHDSFRLFDQPDQSFSWWDYRMMAFRRNAGLRIDHILVSDMLKSMVIECEIDKEPRRHQQPSDHAPVILTLDN